MVLWKMLFVIYPEKIVTLFSSALHTCKSDVRHTRLLRML